MLARKELDQVSLDLLTAAELLPKVGWTRGTRSDAQGRRCLLGVIEGVVGYDTTTKYHTERLSKVLDFSGGGLDEYNHNRISEKSPIDWKIAYWNNMICKDQDEAIAKLKEAAYL